MTRTGVAFLVIAWFLIGCPHFVLGGISGVVRAATSLHAAKLDANEITMYVSNNGSIARNDADTSGNYPGLFYPAETDTPLVYSAGLWITATVNGSPRVAMAERSSEFAPGPYGGEPVGDSSIFRAYKISSSDTLDPSDDWLGWPSLWGAPMRDDGNPLLTGEQSLFTVFNDADVSRHRLRGGSTAPLSAEVKLYAYEFAGSGILDHIVWLRYVIVNKSPDDWRDFIAGIWVDADIGLYADDMGGSDSSRSLVYCYSLEGDSELPAGFVPAVGVVMLDSPSTETTGRPSGSSNVLFNFFRSQSAQMTRNILAGSATDGAEYVDPTTGFPTRYRFGGDPRAGKGWLDTLGRGDRMMVVSSGPADVSSGDSCDVVVAVLAASGGNNVEALDSLFDFADAARDYYILGRSGLELLDDRSHGLIRSVDFTPREQTWIRGVDWGGSTLDGGIGWAGELWGSSFMREDCVDIDLEFHPGAGQKAYRFSEEGGAFRFTGYVPVPFDCIRRADLSQLNVLFIDSDDNGVWAPSSDSGDEADILLVTASRYSDEPQQEYTSALLPNDALQTDLMYALSLGLKPMYERTNLRDGQRLTIKVTPSSEMGTTTETVMTDVPVGLQVSTSVSVRNLYTSTRNFTVAVSKPDEFRLADRVLRISAGDTARFEVIYEPVDTGIDSVLLVVKSTDFNMTTIELPVSAHAVEWPLDGDFVPNGTLDLYDITSLIRYLYRSVGAPPAGVGIDLDGSGAVDLGDAVALINRIFLGY